MLNIQYHKKFKKDYSRIKNRNYDISLLEEVINMLANKKKLPPKYKDHKLEGKYKKMNFRECHITPDWLLIYKIDDDNLTLCLSRTGTHSDLFC